MIESLRHALQTWNKEHSERAKLQHVYLLAAVTLIILAGLIGLINRSLSQNILAVAIFAAIIFLINAVVWALLQSAVIARISSRSGNAKRK